MDRMTRSSTGWPGDAPAGTPAPATRATGLLAGGLAMALLVAGGVSAAARWLFAPVAFEPADGLSLLAPWIAAGAATGVGALMLRAQRARMRRTAAHGPARTPDDVGPLIGPDVATLALGPVAAGVGAWFVVGCGLPLAATLAAGASRPVAVQVVERLEPGALACRYRLVLAGEGLPHPVEACVDREAWIRGEAGSPATAEVVAGPLGLAVRAVDPAR